MLNRIFVTLDKHECVGEVYQEYLLSQEAFDALSKTQEQFLDMSDAEIEDEYTEYGVKTGPVRILKNAADNLSEFFTFDHCADDEKAIVDDSGVLPNLVPEEGQIVIEVIRTIGGLSAETRYSASGLAEVDFDYVYEDYKDADNECDYVDAVVERLQKDISPVRGLLLGVSFDATSLIDFYEDCGEFGGEFDDVNDTLEVYVRDVAGNRTKII